MRAANLHRAATAADRPLRFAAPGETVTVLTGIHVENVDTSVAAARRVAAHAWALGALDRPSYNAVLANLDREPGAAAGITDQVIEALNAAREDGDDGGAEWGLDAGTLYFQTTEWWDEETV